MTIHNKHVMGWDLETTYGSYPGGTPAADDDYHTFGRIIDGQINSFVVTREIEEILDASQWYPTLSAGKCVCTGTIKFIEIGGWWTWMTLGEKDQNTDAKTLTPGSTQKSFTIHDETQHSAGSSDIYRALLGCVIESATWEIDFTGLNQLVCTLNIRGTEEWNQDNGSVVALNNYPDDPASANGEPYSMMGSSASFEWDAAGTPTDIIPQRIALTVNCNLEPPQYAFADSDEEWPVHAGRKRKPLTSFMEIDYWADEQIIENELVSGGSDDIGFKVVDPNDASNHYWDLSYSSCYPSTWKVLHKIKGKALCSARLVGGAISIEVKDGVNYGTGF